MAFLPYLESDGRFHNGALTSLALHGENSLCLSGSEDDKVAVYHLQQGRLISVMHHHTGAVEALGYSPAHPFAASGGMDGLVVIYEMPSMQVRHQLKHDDAVIRVMWHPTMPLIVTASTDKKVRVWDARNGACTRTFQGHTDTILDAVLSKYVEENMGENNGIV